MTLVLEREPNFVSRLYHYYISDADFVLSQKRLSESLSNLMLHLGSTFEQSQIVLNHPRVGFCRNPKPVWDPDLFKRVKETEGQAKEIVERAKTIVFGE